MFASRGRAAAVILSGMPALAACAGGGGASLPTSPLSATRSNPGTQDLPSRTRLLFVANYFKNTVTEYAPPYTGPPIATISNSVNRPFALALGTRGDLFVANDGNDTVTEYARPYTGFPITTISNGVSSPAGVAIFEQP